MNKNINVLIDDLKNLFGNRLVSVILYGSAASSDNYTKLSDINLMIVLDKLNASDLKLANPYIKKWIKSKNPAPMFIDKEEMLNSCDVYAIEYSDIKEKHRVLYGENFISELNINKDDLRQECEYEIRNLLIKFRQAYLVHGTDKKYMESILIKGTSGILAILRAIYRIMDMDIPGSQKEVINLLAQKVSFDKEVLLDILVHKGENKGFAKENIESIIQRLINSLNQILIYIDKLEIS